MATIDALSTIQGTPSGSGTHTPSGTPTGVLCFVNCQNGTITAPTYNGVSMTLVDSEVDGTWTLAVYKLANPPSGAQATAVSTSEGSAHIRAVFVTIAGGSTSDPVASFGGAVDSTGSEKQLSFSVGSGKLAICGFAIASDQTDDFTPTETSQWVYQGSPDPSGAEFRGSSQTGSASTFTFTGGFGTNAARLVAVELADAGSGVTMAWIKA